jgi:hypothetical protein
MSLDPLPTNNDIIEKVEELLEAAYDEKKEFNTALNGGTPIKIPSLVVGQPPHQLEASEILFWTARDAYHDEFSAWEPKHHQDLHRQAIDQLKGNNQLSEFRNLVEVIKKNRLAPFVGAGLSLACKYPLWEKALDEIAAKIPTVDMAAYKAKMASYDYLGAAQLLWDKDDTQVKNYIRNTFDERPIITHGKKGPVTVLPRISRGCVITTNFDPLIEVVFGKGAFDGYMHGNQAGHLFVPRLVKGDRCILKLHGDAANYNTFVFTESQYTQSYGSPMDFSRALPKALRQIFVSHSLLFLGCSLEQDRTLELFQKVYDDKEFDIPDHFAILPQPADPLIKSAKETRLLKLNIRPIWYPHTNHELVEKYLTLAADMAEGRFNSII